MNTIIMENCITKKITTFAIFIVLMIVGGYILTFTSKSIPIPDTDTPTPKGMGFLDRSPSPILSFIKNL
ncbi:hypothetical protein KPL35_08920 [Clostridium sp. CF011]|uniref:hypothetical protein n=1 Tax=Clostridium sp. CF011 TaxID=2843318 RepID=UPI001C0B4249|nr:hypothetical protein [Clostridium sp. CF011]MBU3092198.1 hypothetical protein [Clostridium sp. CF011]